MPTPGQPVPAPATADSVEPVEIFRVGTYSGIPYSREFLEQVVDNYRRYQSKEDPRFPRPPAYYASAEFAKKLAPPLEAGRPDIGIGHENDQAYLRWLLGRTDLPSAGWPKNLRLEGDVLYADFEGMPAAVASLVNGGQLPHCSAEFYQDYTDASGRRYGPALRRVSLLGGEVPKVKSLAPLPVMVFSEPKTHQRTVIYFSEVIPMDRAATIAALQAAGIDTSTITDAIPDAFLASVATALAGQGGAGAPGSVLPPAPVTTNAELNPDGTPKQPVQQFGGSDGVRGNNKPGQIRAMWAKDPDNPYDSNAEDPNKPKDPAVAQFSEMVRGIVNPILQQLGILTGKVASLESSGTQDKQNRERAEVVAFCEKAVREGRVTPYEMADKDTHGKPKPTLADTLLMLDNGQAVVVFGEQRVTQRASMMKMIEMRQPSSGFRQEQMPQPIGDSGGSTLTDQRRREALQHTPLGRSILAREAQKK